MPDYKKEMIKRVKDKVSWYRNTEGKEGVLHEGKFCPFNQLGDDCLRLLIDNNPVALHHLASIERAFSHKHRGQKGNGEMIDLVWEVVSSTDVLAKQAAEFDPPSPSLLDVWEGKCDVKGCPNCESTEEVRGYLKRLTPNITDDLEYDMLEFSRELETPHYDMANERVLRIDYCINRRLSVLIRNDHARFLTEVDYARKTNQTQDIIVLQKLVDLSYSTLEFLKAMGSVSEQWIRFTAKRKENSQQSERSE